MNNQNDNRVSVRLNDELYERVSKGASELGVTKSEYMRLQISGECGTHQFISRGVANQSIVQFINDINPVIAGLSDENKKKIEGSLNTLWQKL